LEGAGLRDYIDKCAIGERSGSSILEDIMCKPKGKAQVLGMLSTKESIAVTCWYLWWQRREIVKGGTVAGATRTAFAV
jgi:hypothetical protein